MCQILQMVRCPLSTLSEGYCTWFVSVSICLLPRFLQPRATRQNSDTNWYIATLAKKAIFVLLLRSKVMA